MADSEEEFWAEEGDEAAAPGVEKQEAENDTWDEPEEKTQQDDAATSWTGKGATKGKAHAAKGKGPAAKGGKSGKAGDTGKSNLWIKGKTRPTYLVQRITRLNRSEIWEQGRGINAGALSAMQTISEDDATQILDDLEKKGADIQNPSGFIFGAVRRAGGGEMQGGDENAPAWKRACPSNDPVFAARPKEVSRPEVLTKVREMAARGVEFNPEAKTALFKLPPKHAFSCLMYLDDRAELPDPSAFLMKGINKEIAKAKLEAEQEARNAAKAAKEEEGENLGEGEGEEEEEPEPDLSIPCDPALFKLRFGEALRMEDAKEARAKGKKGKKGKGKGKKGDKGKDGKGKGKDGKDGKGKDGKGKDGKEGKGKAKQ